MVAVFQQKDKSRADIVWPKMTHPDIERVEKAVAKEFGVKLDELRQDAGRAGWAKWVAVDLAVDSPV